MKNIRKQAPKGMTHYNAESDTYNNNGKGFNLRRLTWCEELIILTALSIPVSLMFLFM